MNSQQFIARFGGLPETNQSGMGSLTRALSAGLTYDEIAAMGINFGPKAAAEINANKGGFIGKYGGSNGMTGLSSVMRAMNDGMTTKEIAAQNIGFGPKAADFLARANLPKPEMPKMFRPGSFTIGNSQNAGGIRANTGSQREGGVTSYGRKELKRQMSNTLGPVMSILGLNI